MLPVSATLDVDDRRKPSASASSAGLGEVGFRANAREHRLRGTSHNRSNEGRALEAPTWHDQGVDDELGYDGTEMRAEIERIEAELRQHPGRRAHSQVVDLERAWNTHRNASTNILALVQAGETDEAMAVDLIRWHDVQRVHAVEIDAANKLVRQRNLVLTGGQFEDQASFMAMVQKSVRDYREAQGSGPGVDATT